MSRLLILFLTVSLGSPVSSGAYWVWSPESGKFVNPEGAVEDTSDQQYDYALSFYETRNYDKAIEELKNLLKKYPASKVAPEAQFRLGSIYEEQNEFYKAFQAYQKIADNYPNSARMNEVIERQFRIGNVFLSGKKGKFMGVPVLPALPRAVEVFEQVVKNAPFGEHGDKAMFQLGIACRRTGDLKKAVETLQALIENYPDSPLVPDAKYQLGEVSYDLSKNITRSYEGLESAEDYFESFLSEDSASNVREKALRLKKAIDEKSAEKNFKIGEYYEKENYLDSAIIYYEDVVRNYGETSWAANAKEKLALFRSPVKFVKAKQDALETELARVALRKKEIEEAVERVPEGAKLKRSPLEAKLKLLAKKEKELKASVRSFGRRKVSDLRRRREALKRKESELKEKQKALARKKKLLKDNPSEDLTQAFKSWSESLRAEELALRQEKAERGRIERELGIRTGLRIPFTEPETLEDLREMYVDDLADLMNEKKMWDLRKEELYEFRSEVLTQLDQLQGEDVELLFRKKEFQELLEQSGSGLKKKMLETDREEAQLDLLRERLDAKERELAAFKGKGRWKKIWTAPKRTAKHSWDRITFSSDKPEERLKEARQEDRRLSKDITEQKGMVETIHKAFEGELAGRRAPSRKSGRLKEGKVSARLSEDMRLKKQIKLLEREIRWRYEEIQDRSHSKQQKMDKLDVLIETLKAQGPAIFKAGRTVSAPALGTYKFFRAFLFGLKPREEVIRRESLAVQSQGSYEKDRDRVQKLREGIELESILIEARASEIKTLQKDLARLKDQADKRKGFSYRSVFVERPGSFLEDVVASARKVLPRKERREILIDRLDRETRALKQMRGQRGALREAIQELESKLESGQGALPARTPVQTETRENRAARIVRLEAEVEALGKEFGRREETYDRERNKVREELKDFYRERLAKRFEERFGLGDRAFRDKKKLYDQERKKAEEEILGILKKEEKIVRRVEELLMDKKKKIREKITGFKETEDYHSEVLENEMEDLLDQSRHLRMERQNLLEERKKVSESLKAEVGSFEK